MSSIPEALAAGLEHHRAGRLQQAEMMYRRVLQMHPRHSGAAHLLGLIAFQAGKLDMAEKLVTAAIQIDAFRAPYSADLAEIYAAQGKSGEAIAAYRRAIELNSESAEYHANLGKLLRAAGRLDEALVVLRDAVNLDPEHAAATGDLAAVLHAQGELAEARVFYETAVRLAPDSAEVYLGFGRCLRALRDLRAAVACFQMAVRLSPVWPLAHFHLARAQHLRGELSEASAGFQEAVRLRPDFAQAHAQWGAVLRDQGLLAEAIARFEEALRLDPRLALAHLGLAQTFMLWDRPDEAAAASRRAVELEPQSHRAAAHLASALQMQGEAEEAVAELRRAHRLAPGDYHVHCQLIHALNFVPGEDRHEIAQEHRAWARRHADPLTAAAAPHANDRTPDRPLRIGYLSGHFFRHAVSYFSLPLLAAHDRGQFEVYCYHSGTQADAVTERFRAAAAGFRDVGRLSDDELAERIRADQIDLLIDLVGHIQGNRLLAAARRPAPVQIAYLGYQNTTGMAAFDYRLTDAQCDPPGDADSFYTERLVRLEDRFFCYEPLEVAPDVNELPALASGRVTLGWLNNILKTNRHSIALWCRVLRELPATRLLVLAPGGGSFERRVRRALAEAGIADDRLEIVNRCPSSEYLRLHHRIDLALDSFPFNGHTTVCNALWMGVPSIVRQGDCYAARFGGSSLLGLGLNELVTTSDDAYVQTIATLAGDLPRLAELRRSLRGRMSASPLMDAAGFARRVESVYRRMWQKWCAEAGGSD